MIENALLAVDSGGTKCDMLLVDAATGDLLARAHGHSSEIPNVVSPGGAGRSTEMAQLVWSRIRQQYGDTPLPRLSLAANIVASKILGLEGVDDRVDRIVPVTEPDAALALGGVEHGLVVLSGTGASIFSHQPEGENRSLDGLGPLLGDEGGSYWIGARLMRRLTKLTQLDAGPVPGWSELVEFLGYGDLPKPIWGVIGMMAHNPDRSTIAAVSRLVERLAAEGNLIARGILEEAAERLAANTVMLADRIGIGPEDEVTIVGVGSVLTRGKVVWPLLAERLTAHFRRGRILCPRLPQVAGQVFSVLRRDGNHRALENFTAIINQLEG